jgi:predicted transcriptional regulator
MTQYEKEIEALKGRIVKLLEQGEHRVGDMCVALRYRPMHVRWALKQLVDEHKVIADDRVYGVYSLTGNSTNAKNIKEVV